MPDTRQQTIATVTKVRAWAKQLQTGAASGLRTIAEAEGISIARVSQLMVLERLTPLQIYVLLKHTKRVSLRALIREARRICSPI